MCKRIKRGKTKVVVDHWGLMAKIREAKQPSQEPKKVYQDRDIGQNIQWVSCISGRSTDDEEKTMDEVVVY